MIMRKTIVKRIGPQVQVFLHRRKFRRGLNFFVSPDVSLAEALGVGEFFELDGWDGVAQVVRLYQTTFDRLPAEVYDYHHDPACRSYEGLKRVLEEVISGDDEDRFSLTDDVIVVAVGFYLYKRYRFQQLLKGG